MTVLAAAVAAALFAACAGQNRRPAAPGETSRAKATPQPRPSAGPKVPAHYEAEPPKGSLATTLAPETFTGRTREAYRAVGEMPELIAQMPCYCHCDEGFGHKSLQSCFVDDHAAHCDVCVREALAAYRLRKEQGLSAAEIRRRIVAEYLNL